jgi:hypothetical protein
MNKRIIIGLAIIAIAISTESQSRWVKQYMEGENAPGHYISTAYDPGYLLTGRILPSYQYTWLVKTDVNGEVLWEKFIGGNHDRVIVDCFSQNRIGETYLSGGFYDDGNTDPFILKLNVCGEMEWCQSISTTSDYDFYADIITTIDNGCAALIVQSFYPLRIYRNGIIRFSRDGILLWQQYYQSDDPGVNNEELLDMIMTPDSGFLLTGTCYYPDLDNPDLNWLHPYYVKTDSLGNFEWETIVHKETADMGGEAWETVINPSKEYYYSSINHYYHSDSLYTKRPAFIKIDLDGNVEGVYDLVHQNYDWGMLVSATFINDSLLAGGAGWGYNEDVPLSRAVIFDTLGNIRDSVVLLEDGYLSSTAVTHDGKLLFYNTIEENGDFDTYLFKLTQDLEQDTFYTTPFVYDSLCPYHIVSDTIVPDDCGVIVGIEEDMETGGHGDKETRGELEVWPNPAREVLNFKFSILNSGLDYSICIYDIFGREVRKIKIPNEQDGFRLNVAAFSPGLYIIIMRNETDILGSRKFVIAR